MIEGPRSIFLRIFHAEVDQYLSFIYFYLKCRECFELMPLSDLNQIHCNIQLFNVNNPCVYFHMCMIYLLSKWLHVFQHKHYCTVCLDLLGLKVHRDRRLKTARKSIHLVNHSWINRSLWLWPINRRQGAETPGWPLGEPLGETQRTGSLFIAEAAGVLPSSAGSPTSISAYLS